MIDPICRQTKALRVRQYLASGRLDYAEQCLRNAIEQDPTWCEAFLELAKLLVTKKRMQEAKQVSHSAARNFAYNPDAWLFDATLNINLKNKHASWMSIKRGILVEPTRLEGYSLCGSVVISVLSKETVAAILSRMLIIAPGRAKNLLDHAKQLSAAIGVSPELLPVLSKAAVLAPHDAETWYVRGLVELGVYNPRESYSSLKRALIIAPFNASCEYQLSRAAFHLDAQVEAEIAARNALRLGHSEMQARFMLARILRVSDRVEEANREFHRLEQIDPGANRKRRTVEWTVTGRDFSGKRQNNSNVTGRP